MPTHTKIKGKKVILTTSKEYGLGWGGVVRLGHVGKVRAALEKGEITGKISQYTGDKGCSVVIDWPWNQYFQYKDISFSRHDLIFIKEPEPDFITVDDLAL